LIPLQKLSLRVRQTRAVKTNDKVLSDRHLSTVDDFPAVRNAKIPALRAFFCSSGIRGSNPLVNVRTEFEVEPSSGFIPSDDAKSLKLRNSDMKEEIAPRFEILKRSEITSAPAALPFPHEPVSAR
jgi:hypothetical protein